MIFTDYARFTGKSLFSDESLSDWLRKREEHAIAEIESWDDDQVRFSPEAVAAQVASEYGLKPIAVMWDEISRSPIKEVDIEGRDAFDRNRPVVQRGHRVTVTAPITGEQDLFRYKASQFTWGGYPQGLVRSGELVITHESARMTGADVTAFVESYKAALTKYCGWTNKDVGAWSSGLEDRLTKVARARKQRLDTTAELEAAVQIPLRQTTDDRRVSVAINRKRISPPSRSAKRPSPATPVLDQAIYEDVIEMIRHVGNTVERLPSTASKFNEEEWRDLLLFILNANFEGGLHGEAFNGDGKTDLLLRHDDRNVFIGECKVWRGEARFGDALDQLLGYTVWRDSKAALILFIKNKDASSVVEKALHTLRTHASFVSEKPANDPQSRSDFLVRSAVDPEKRISVAVLPVVIGRTELT